ncbi:hypothetical protein B0H19DRAFT_1266664 [Mycena capillaripes]|nr:hypothetical protein B0H19DRAFT_1266664 [Mycena capillaripes]
MHFAAQNYLRIIVSIAVLVRAIVVYGTPVANTAPAVEEVTARDEILEWPRRVPDELKARIFSWPVSDVGEPEDIESEAISNDEDVN